MTAVRLNKEQLQKVHDHISSKKKIICDCNAPNVVIEPEIINLIIKTDNNSPNPAYESIVAVCENCGEIKHYSTKACGL